MTRRIRTILFLFLAILFLIIAPLTVLYCLGWRFDFKTKKAIQPGIFYFKVLPSNTYIYLDGNLKKKTDFFFGSALIENLLPKKYNVEIKKEGFHSWKKTLEIKERQVTEAKNIVLAPENPKFTSILRGIENFYLSDDNKKIILKEVANTGPETSLNQENSSLLNGQIPSKSWALKLFELDKNVKSHLIDERDISKEEVQLIDLKFSPDSKRILLKVGLKESLRYYILVLGQSVGKGSPSLDFLDTNIEGVYFNPKNPQKLLLLGTSADGKASYLSEADLTNKKISSPLFENVITASVFGDNIYYLDASGFLFKTDFSFNGKEGLNIVPFPLTKETGYKIAVSNSHICLKENNILYIFDENKKSFQKIFEPLKNLKFSPDSNKLVYFNDYEIWVLFLEKKYDQPQKETGEQVFITRFSEKIDEVFWYTDHYLIFNVADKIKVAEIDDRDKINIVDISEFKNPQIFFNENNKKLYILSLGNLYVTEKPLR